MKLMGVIFTPEFSIGNRSSLIDIFKDIIGDRFDGELISLPIPQEAPPQFPRIEFISKDGAWKIQISLQRTNLFFIKPLNLSVDVPTIVDFSKLVSEIFESYKKSTDIKIQRLALVTERISEFEKEPAKYIANKFCKKEYVKGLFENPNAFELHFLKSYAHENFNINSWVRFKSAILQDKLKTSVLFVENDINTFADDLDKNFDAKEIDLFFSTMSSHIEKVFELYLK